MDQKQMDEILDNATHAVNEVWQRSTGKSLDMDELDDLNDALAAFFDEHNETIEALAELDN
jgi:hypothetical protein